MGDDLIEEHWCFVVQNGGSVVFLREKFYKTTPKCRNELNALLFHDKSDSVAFCQAWLHIIIKCHTKGHQTDLSSKNETRTKLPNIFVAFRTAGHVGRNVTS